MSGPYLAGCDGGSLPPPAAFQWLRLRVEQRRAARRQQPAAALAALRARVVAAACRRRPVRVPPRSHDPVAVLLSPLSREDQEDCARHQVQGPVQQVPVHAVRHRLGQGGQAEAVAAAGCAPAVQGRAGAALARCLLEKPALSAAFSHARSQASPSLTLPRILALWCEEPKLLSGCRIGPLRRSFPPRTAASMFPPRRASAGGTAERGRTRVDIDRTRTKLSRGQPAPSG